MRHKAPHILAALGPRLAARALAAAPGAFAVAADLRRESSRLEAALATEAEAEALSHSTTGDAIEARDTLQQVIVALQPAPGRLVAVQDVALEAALRPAFDAWADPYAPDTTGAAELDALARIAHHHDAPAAATVAAAVTAMHAAGTAHDHAASARAQAIAERVAAEKEWQRAFDALLAVVPAGVRSELVAAVSETTPSEPDPTDAWFAE